jgi:hypothetical protein
MLGILYSLTHGGQNTSGVRVNWVKQLLVQRPHFSNALISLVTHGE